MREPAGYWPLAYITIDHRTNEQTITFSETPEQFVAKLEALDLYVYVAQGCCSECFYTPNSPTPEEKLRQYERSEIEPYHRVLDCLHHTVAYELRYTLPDMIVCYGYYYQHWHKNQFLQAAREANRIRFWDVSDLPELAGSGLLINVAEWFK